MKFEYSEAEDALYIYFKEAEVSRSQDVDEGIIVDYDARGGVVGIEVLDASERVVAGDGLPIRGMFAKDPSLVPGGDEE